MSDAAPQKKSGNDSDSLLSNDSNIKVKFRYMYKRGVVVGDDVVADAIKSGKDMFLESFYVIRFAKPIKCMMFVYGLDGGGLFPDAPLVALDFPMFGSGNSRKADRATDRLLQALNPTRSLPLNVRWWWVDLVTSEAVVLRIPCESKRMSDLDDDMKDIWAVAIEKEERAQKAQDKKGEMTKLDKELKRRLESKYKKTTQPDVFEQQLSEIPIRCSEEIPKEAGPKGRGRGRAQRGIGRPPKALRGLSGQPLRGLSGQPLRGLSGQPLRGRGRPPVQRKLCEDAGNSSSLESALCQSARKSRNYAFLRPLPQLSPGPLLPNLTPQSPPAEAPSKMEEDRLSDGEEEDLSSDKSGDDIEIGYNDTSDNLFGED